jgi:hypothetical protein
LLVARRMISISSAPGWKARFLDDDAPHGSRVVTLVSWALVEDAGRATEIVGVVQRAATEESRQGWLGFADEVEGFQGYTFTGLATSGSEPA